MSKLQGAVYPILWGAISGVLLALSLPKPDLYPLAWIAFTPLYIVLAKSVSLRQSAVVGYFAGLGYYLGTCYWMSDTMMTYGGLGVVAAFGVLALFCLSHAFYFALFGVAVRAFMRRYGTWGLLLVPPLWVAMELARAYFPLGGFPWMFSGYALVPYAGLLQIVTWTGVYGLSFVVASVNALFAWAALTRNRNPRRAAIALIVPLAATILPAPAESPVGDPVAVRLVQTNIALNQSWDDPQAIPRLVDQLAAHSIGMPAPMDATISRLLVWPENPAPFSLDDPDFRRRAQKIAAESESHFIFGYNDSREDTPTNSAALFDPYGRRVSRYDKMHLVPFGEYVPMKDLLFFAGKLIEQVGDYAPGTEITVSPIDGHSLGTVICYESIFPSLSRKMVARGAELLVVITNDGWFGSSSAPYQHLRMGVVRAVENRRYMVRAANTGITVVIDPYGRIISRAPAGVRTVLDGVARFRSDRTFYTEYGDLFAYANAAVSVIFGILGLAKPR